MKFRLAVLAFALLSVISAMATQSINYNYGGVSPSFVNPSNVIFDDGATNGFYNGFFVDGPNPGPFSQWIADEFVATGSGAPGELDFGIWVPTGATPTTITYWLGVTYLDSSISGGAPIAITPGMYTFHNSNSYGYDVYDVKLFISGSMMTAGNTYWLTLGNANDSFGTQFDAWDVSGGPAVCNFGVGGTYYGGCGDGGEAFTLKTGVPEPGIIFMLGSGAIGVAGVLRRKLF